MSPKWTTPDAIAARVKRRWDDGSLLRAVAEGRPFQPIEIPIRGPKPSEIGDDIGAVRDWVARLDAGRCDGTHYALEWAPVGGRSIGRNDVPVRAFVTAFGQAWALLGVARSVRRFDGILRLTRDRPAVHSWVIAHPHRALELHEKMPQLIAAHAWLDGNRHSGRYLREISAPGVDTKFAERHRSVLAAMLGVPSTGPGFLAALGLSSKPELVRIRPAPSLGLPRPLTEMALRTAELAQLAVEPRCALVIENEITYLTVPVPDDGIVLWGKGFEVDRVGRLPWLAHADIAYWGDIDTHGFAILNAFRAWLPQTRSVLMDRATLLAHSDRWVTEDAPTTAPLVRLTAEERLLYNDIVEGNMGQQVRLEQERIDWSWAEQRLRLAMTAASTRPSDNVSPDRAV